MFYIETLVSLYDCPQNVALQLITGEIIFLPTSKYHTDGSRTIGLVGGNNAKYRVYEFILRKVVTDAACANRAFCFSTFH